MKRVLVGLVTGALLVGSAVAGLVLLRRDPPTASERCERLTRADLPPRGGSRLGDRLGLLVPGSVAEHVGAARAVHVGDPGVGQVAAAFRSGDCTYTVWWPDGTRMPEVRAWLRGR